MPGQGENEGAVCWILLMADEKEVEEGTGIESGHQWVNHPYEVEFDYDELGEEEMGARRMEGTGRKWAANVAAQGRGGDVKR